MLAKTHIFAAIGLALIATAAQARNFGAPVQLSVNNHAGMTGVAIDDAGNALAAWADSGFYYSDHPAGGSWSAPQSLYIGGAFPVLHMTGDGSATIVSYSSLYGIWSVDRPAGGAWTSPFLIVDAPDIVSSNLNNVSPVQFLENAKGDQAIVFQQYLGGNTVITAVHRPAGGGWSSEDNVASSADYGHIAFSSSAIGGNGDLIVSFETFDVVCNKYCHDINYVVHAAREAAGTTTWKDSGALTPESSAYNTKAVVDSNGHAGVLIQNGFAAEIDVATQAKAGAKWKPLVPAFDPTGLNGAQIWLAEAGNKGFANLAFVTFSDSGANATVLDGNVAKDSWGTLNFLSLGDSPGANDNMVFDANLAGGAVAEWTDVDGTVRAALRKKGGVAWGTAQTIIGGSQCNIGGLVCTGAVASAVNAKGQAVIGFIRLDPDDTISNFFVSATP